MKERKEKENIISIWFQLDKIPFIKGIDTSIGCRIANTILFEEKFHPDTSSPPSFDLNSKFKLIPIGGRFSTSFLKFPYIQRRINFMTLLNFPPSWSKFPRISFYTDQSASRPRWNLSFSFQFVPYLTGSRRCKDVSGDVSDACLSQSNLCRVERTMYE